MIFPNRILPPRSEQRGRAIEGEIREQVKSLRQFNSSVGNSGRYSSGQLSVMARSLDELASRSAEIVRLGSFSVSGSATSEPFPRQERDVTSPAVFTLTIVRGGFTASTTTETLTNTRVYVTPAQKNM